MTTVGYQDVDEFKIVAEPPSRRPRLRTGMRCGSSSSSSLRSATLEGDPPRSIGVEGFGGTEMALGLLADLEHLAGTPCISSTDWCRGPGLNPGRR